MDCQQGVKHGTSNLVHTKHPYNAHDIGEEAFAIYHLILIHGTMQALQKISSPGDPQSIDAWQITRCFYFLQSLHGFISFFVVMHETVKKGLSCLEW